MKTISAILFSTALLSIAGSAQAADLPYRAAAPAPAPIWSWTGFYIGAQGGFGTAKLDNLPDANPSGGLAGGQIGYNYQFGNWVIGFEGDGDWADLKKSTTVGILTATEKVKALASARVRLGIAFDRALLYGTGGFGLGVGELSLSALGTTISNSQTHTGFTAGGGIEYAVIPNVSLRGEYLFYGLSSKDYSLVGVPIGGTGNVNVHTVKFGINYLFH